MRIAIVADSHFDESSRFDECIRLHEWIVRDARDQGCRAWLHAGDVYERKSTPRERLAVAAWVQDMASLVGPGAIVRGNHDALDDLTLLQRLDTKHPVHVVDGARVVQLGALAVACMSWPRRSHVHAMVKGDASKELVELVSADALRAVLRGLGAELREHARPRVLLSHAMVRGSVTSTGQPLVGCDFELGLDDLALCGADLYALGHIHKGQAWEIAGAPAVYPGSPRRTAFGELEPKGYTIAEWDFAEVGEERGRFRCEFRAAPATPMMQYEADFDGDELRFRGAGPGAEEIENAEVRLRYHVAANRREAARAAAEAMRERMLAWDAVSVKVEEIVIAEQRSRAPGIVTAATITDKLEALWRVKNFDPGDRRQMLLGKAANIEEESRAT